MAEQDLITAFSACKTGSKNAFIKENTLASVLSANKIDVHAVNCNNELISILDIIFRKTGEQCMDVVLLTDSLNEHASEFHDLICHAFPDVNVHSYQNCIRWKTTHTKDNKLRIITTNFYKFRGICCKHLYFHICSTKSTLVEAIQDEPYHSVFLDLIDPNTKDDRGCVHILFEHVH